MITPIMNYEVVFAVVWRWSNFKVFFILKYIKINFYLALLKVWLFSWLVTGFSKLKKFIKFIKLF